jgi:2-amino-4-hydroxy-6-hydroxymethyldihydropteridine diphosphokinase
VAVARREGDDGAVSGLLDVYVGLGANLGGARASLQRAVAALAALPGVSVRAVSGLYRTRPVGPADQPDFLNAVAALEASSDADPTAPALALLGSLKGIERTLGRRERARWGPREVDLDLLLFGPHVIHVRRDEASRSSDRAPVAGQWLDVPHPAAHERLFVLAPLAEVAPDLVPPGWTRSVAHARDDAWRREGPAAATRVADWDPELGVWVESMPNDGSDGAP